MLSGGYQQQKLRAHVQRLYMILTCGVRSEGLDFPKQRNILSLALCCCYGTLLLTTSLTSWEIYLQRYFFTLQDSFEGFLANFLLVLTHVVLRWPKLNPPVNYLDDVFNFACVYVYLLGFCCYVIVVCFV